MNTVTAGPRSFSQPLKPRYADISSGPEWRPYKHQSDSHSSHLMGCHSIDSSDMESLQDSARHMPSYNCSDDSYRRLDLSKLFDDVPINHKFFLDPEYEAEMLKHKRDVLQSVVDSHDLSRGVPVLSFLDECRMLQYMCECLEAACMLKGIDANQQLRASSASAPASFRPWLSRNLTKQDPVFASIISGGTSLDDLPRTLKCPVRSCRHYVYGFATKEGLHSHMRTHLVAGVELFQGQDEIKSRRIGRYPGKPEMDTVQLPRTPPEQREHVERDYARVDGMDNDAVQPHAFMRPKSPTLTGTTLSPNPDGTAYGEDSHRLRYFPPSESHLSPRMRPAESDARRESVQPDTRRESQHDTLPPIRQLDLPSDQNSQHHSYIAASQSQALAQFSHVLRFDTVTSSSLRSSAPSSPRHRIRAPEYGRSDRGHLVHDNPDVQTLYGGQDALPPFSALDPAGSSIPARLESTRKDDRSREVKSDTVRVKSELKQHLEEACLQTCLRCAGQEAGSCKCIVPLRDDDSHWYRVDTYRGTIASVAKSLVPGSPIGERPARHGTLLFGPIRQAAVRKLRRDVDDYLRSILRFPDNISVSIRDTTDFNDSFWRMGDLSHEKNIIEQIVATKAWNISTPPPAILCTLLYATLKTQQPYNIIHIIGTSGKFSTSRRDEELSNPALYHAKHLLREVTFYGLSGNTPFIGAPCAERRGPPFPDDAVRDDQAEVVETCMASFLRAFEASCRDGREKSPKQWLALFCSLVILHLSGLILGGAREASLKSPFNADDHAFALGFWDTLRSTFDVLIDLFFEVGPMLFDRVSQEWDEDDIAAYDMMAKALLYGDWKNRRIANSAEFLLALSNFTVEKSIESTKQAIETLSTGREGWRRDSHRTDSSRRTSYYNESVPRAHADRIEDRPGPMTNIAFPRLQADSYRTSGSNEATLDYTKSRAFSRDHSLVSALNGYAHSETGSYRVHEYLHSGSSLRMNDHTWQSTPHLAPSRRSSPGPTEPDSLSLTGVVSPEGRSPMSLANLMSKAGPPHALGRPLSPRGQMSRRDMGYGYSSHYDGRTTSHGGLTSLGDRLERRPSFIGSSRSVTSSRRDSSAPVAIPSGPPNIKPTYQRPPLRRVYCTHCNDYPEGFRGEHELRRHTHARHAALVRRWVCREPTRRHPNQPWTSVPLSTCKSCMTQKSYGAYYNAAAHLRRAHFPPTRNGKSASDWPSMSVLKEWMQEVCVAPDSASEGKGKGKGRATSDGQVVDLDSDDEMEDANGQENGIELSNHAGAEDVAAASSVNRSGESPDEPAGGQKCPYPECGRVLRDLAAHMLTHQAERPEKCPVPSCVYYTKGFARKYDKNRHALTHYRGTLICPLCPTKGENNVESVFSRADVFKRHLASVHSVETSTGPLINGEESASVSVAATASALSASESALSASMMSRPVADPKTLQNEGCCSICDAYFPYAQEFYEHLDECVLAALVAPETLANAQSSVGGGRGSSYASMPPPPPPRVGSPTYSVGSGRSQTTQGSRLHHGAPESMTSMSYSYRQYADHGSRPGSTASARSFDSARRSGQIHVHAHTQLHAPRPMGVPLPPPSTCGSFDSDLN